MPFVGVGGGGMTLRATESPDIRLEGIVRQVAAGGNRRLEMRPINISRWEGHRKTDDFEWGKVVRRPNPP